MLEKEKRILKAAWTLLNLPANKEYQVEIETGDHAISIEALPYTAFKVKDQGMGYEKFKREYPSLVNWIESNGWVYSREHDGSIVTGEVYKKN